MHLPHYTKAEILVLLRRAVTNKYVITLFISLFIFMFAGEQSWINDFKRARQIRSLEQQLEETRRQNEQCEREIRTLRSIDSLERYAREHYYMHAPDEDVYLVSD